MRRVRSSSTGPAEIADPDMSSVGYVRLGPRCGRVMLGYEGIWGALLDDVRCGRPEGHRGVCRSVQSLDREKVKTAARWPVYQARRRARDRLAKGLLRQTQAHSLQIQCPSTRMMSWPTRTWWPQ